MTVVKVNLALVTLLSFMVGAIGTADAQQIRTASLDSAQVRSDVRQHAKSSRTIVEITGAGVISLPASPVAEELTAIQPAEQFSQISFRQPVQTVPTKLAVAPLITLGSNDDLTSMVERASGVILIDFYADWCGPCRRQGGILHEMEHTASQNNASIIKVNVDQHRQLASAYNVTSMPTLILIKNGQIIERQSGVANHQRVASLLSR